MTICALSLYRRAILSLTAANFPYLVDPFSAISDYVHDQSPTTNISSVFDDYNYASVNSTAAQADVCLVFVNADSGEGYITVDGNAGDRNNLTLWHSGDQLILNTASHCANTIVVMHIVGPVIVEAWYDHPNVTAIINAGLPGQESGNAIVDVLTGAVNPSGRLVYTMAKQRSDYASDVVYTADSYDDSFIPQIDYTEKLCTLLRFTLLFASDTISFSTSTPAYPFFPQNSDRLSLVRRQEHRAPIRIRLWSQLYHFRLLWSLPRRQVLQRRRLHIRPPVLVLILEPTRWRGRSLRIRPHRFIHRGEHRCI